MDWLSNHHLRRLGGKFARAALGEQRFSKLKSLSEVEQLKQTVLSLERRIRINEEVTKNAQREYSTFEREYHQFLRLSRKSFVPVREPLILISQIQRSGGTLLSQLFDGHPQCHAHPYELQIGFPTKYDWPCINLADDPDKWFKQLEEAHVERSYYEGYKKPANEFIEDYDSFPFLLVPSLQKLIFRECASKDKMSSLRDVLNAYMTSYFNAWLDNANIYGSKKFVTAFVPRMHMKSNNIEEFFETYPDGYLISIVRDPRSWFVSARKHVSAEYGDASRAIELWLQSTKASLDAKQKYQDRVVLVSFEQLVADTEGVMRRICRSLNFDFDKCLLQPTYNGQPIRADSVFPVETTGIIQAPVDRYKECLTAEEITQIDAKTKDLRSKIEVVINSDFVAQ